MVSAYNFKSPDEGKFTLAANAFLPSHCVVPLDGEILTSEGEQVKEGQVIAKTKDIYIHAPVSGVVEKISAGVFSSGKKGLCAKIALKGSLVFIGKKSFETGWQSYEKETLAYKLKEAGVLSTFSRKISLYTTIKNLKKKNPVLVLRLFDDDPSVLTERFVSKNYARQVIFGAMILAKASGAEILVIAQDRYSKVPVGEFLPENFEEQIFSNQNSENLENLENQSFAKRFENQIKVFQVEVDPRKYPCGSEHCLVSAVKKNLSDESLKSIGKNDFFVDSVTAFHAYNAIVLGKPEINALVHVTGECLNSAAVMDVKLGTSLRDVAEMCGGFKRKLSRIVINGTVKGVSVKNLDIPVVKSMKSIEFVPARQVKNPSSETCVRCGNCRKICPAELWPGNLYRIMHLDGKNGGLLDSKTIADSAILCMECGLCNSVCPSRLPLQKTISLLKEKINDDEHKNE